MTLLEQPPEKPSIEKCCKNEEICPALIVSRIKAIGAKTMYQSTFPLFSKLISPVVSGHKGKKEGEGRKAGKGAE